MNTRIISRAGVWYSSGFGRVVASGLAMCMMLSSCGAETTQVNLPATGSAANRRMVLATAAMPQSFGLVSASASYRDGDATGFGPGVFITCNDITVIDTRISRYHPDTNCLLQAGSFVTFNWHYEGLDTTFDVSMSTPLLKITSPLAGGSVTRGQPLNLIYDPVGPCVNLSPTFTDRTGHAVPVTVSFDSVTGLISSFPVPKELAAGFGSLSLSKTDEVRTSTRLTGLIKVQNTFTSQNSSINFQ